MPRSAVWLGAIWVIVVLCCWWAWLLAGRCTPFCSLYAWAAKGGANFNTYVACCTQQLLTWASRQSNDITVLMTYQDKSLDIPKLNKTRWDIPGYPCLWLIQGYPKTSTFVQTSSLMFFSDGKTAGWYKSSLVRLILLILFHTKYQRDIPG